MDILGGTMLVKKDKSQISVEDALGSKEIIGFYFSAHWCPPCRKFTPVLAEMYKQLQDEDAPFEVIFISYDNEPDKMFKYMQESHGDWMAVPHGSQTEGELKSRYEIDQIPTLIIVKRDGNLITRNGDTDVETKGLQAFKIWSSK